MKMSGSKKSYEKYGILADTFLSTSKLAFHNWAYNTIQSKIIHILNARKFYKNIR